MHKNSRLTEYQRKEIWREYGEGRKKPPELATKYNVSIPTIYKVLKRARLQEFKPRDSTNKRYKLAKYGIKRLSKIEKKLEEKKRKEAKRYNKKYPGELFHFDTKRLPLLKGESPTEKREYLFVGIDDFSRELYAEIHPDKTQFSSSKFLESVLEDIPYTMEYAYSDNGKEYKGTPDHCFVALCKEKGIGQKFTRVNRPQTNGKAERVIRTIMEMWHEKNIFSSREERKLSLNRFINYYNTVKPHKGIDNKTPLEKLLEYFYPPQSSIEPEGSREQKKE